jgi:hypothetical protein
MKRGQISSFTGSVALDVFLLVLLLLFVGLVLSDKLQGAVDFLLRWKRYG